MLVDQAINYLNNLKKERQKERIKRAENAIDYLKALEPKNYDDDVRCYTRYLCFKCAERRRTVSVTDTDGLIKKCCKKCREKHGLNVWRMEVK